MKKIALLSMALLLLCSAQISARRNVVEFEGHKIRFPRNMYHRLYEKDIEEKKSPEKEIINPRIFDLKNTIPIPMYYDQITPDRLRNLA